MHGPDRLGVTWLGHATVQVELAGVTVLTDPALTPRLAHLRRHETVDLERVVRPDVVLISHVHMDHLHVPSLRMLGDDIEMIVPSGAAAMLRRRGFRRVRETRAGQTAAIGPVTIETVPAVHDSRRGPHSRVAADAVGYVLRSVDGSVYFPGDTDVFGAMETFAPVDAALLPIWGWGPTLGDGHLDPDRAVRATELLQPNLVIPIHWGTYSPVAIRRGAPGWLHHPVDRFQSGLVRSGEVDRLRVLEPGGRLVVPATGAAAVPA